MESIAFEGEKGKGFSGRMRRFFSRFQIGGILRECNAYKERGIPALTVLAYLFSLAFKGRSLYLDTLLKKAPGFGKDTAYRFRNSVKINWLRFVTTLSYRVYHTAIKPLTNETREGAFIIDDSVFERARSKCVELLARVYDHAGNRYTLGFRMLTLGWSDGATFLPINFCLLSTENAKNRKVEAKTYDKRSYAAEIRELSQTKATEVVLRLLDLALHAGYRAGYVLFDRWFSSPKMILALKKMELETVAMVKKSSKIFYAYQGKWMSATSIYTQCKKRRGRSKYLLSVTVGVGRQERLPAKLVFVRNRNKRSEYLVLICTDISLSEEEIIRLYGKRWDIEVFFKTCKSLLKLEDECRSLSYDAMCAQAAIVFTRYLFLAVEIREEKDLRSAGPLFCLVSEELPDITFTEAMEKLQLFLQKLFSGLTGALSDIPGFFTSLLAELPPVVANFLDFSAFRNASQTLLCSLPE